MENLLKGIMSGMSSVKKPQQSFMEELFRVLGIFVGKANFRNLSRYCSLHEKTFARWSRREFDYLDFNKQLLNSEGVLSGERIAALDASFLSKAGKKTEGLGSFWNGKNSKSENGLEISLLSIVDLHSNTAYALNARQTIDDTTGDKTRMDAYAQYVEESATTLQSMGISCITVDCLYTKVKFLNRVCATGLNVIGKMRCDADLKRRYTGQYSGKGRPRKFDGKVNIKDDLNLLEYVGTLEGEVKVYTEVLYAPKFERDLKVVVLQWQQHEKEQYAILYSTDTQLDAKTIVKYYKARFQIEFVFRDAKQHTGLADCQSRKKEAIHNHINAAFATLNLIKVEDQKYSNIDGERVIPIAKNN